MFIPDLEGKDPLVCRLTVKNVGYNVSNNENEHN